MGSRTIEQVKEALRQEEKLYQALLHLGREKSRLVVHNQVRELEQLTEKEQEFIREMSRFEQIRHSLLQHFAQEKELEEAPKNLSGLLLFLEENEKEEVEMLRDRLADLVGQISEQNRQNEALINQSLDFIRMNIELFTHQESTTPYDRKADENKKQNKRLFDAKF